MVIFINTSFKTFRVSILAAYKFDLHFDICIIKGHINVIIQHAIKYHPYYNYIAMQIALFTSNESQLSNII